MKIHQHFCGYRINFKSLSYLNFERERRRDGNALVVGWVYVPVCIKHSIEIPMKKRFIILCMYGGLNGVN